MWIAEKNERSIERAKTRIKLIYTGENPYATCEDSTHCLPAGTFFGSDADREIYYLEVVEELPSTKYVIKHSTKGFFNGNTWIFRSENIKWATRFNSIDEAIEKAKTLKSSTGELLNSLQIISFQHNGFGLSFTLWAEVYPKISEVRRFDGTKQLANPE